MINAEPPTPKNDGFWKENWLHRSLGQLKCVVTDMA